MNALTLLEKKIRTLVQSLQELQAQHVQLQKEHEQIINENARLLESIRQLEDKNFHETEQLHHEKAETKRMVDELLAHIEELPLDVHSQDQEQKFS